MRRTLILACVFGCIFQMTFLVASRYSLAQSKKDKPVQIKIQNIEDKLSEVRRDQLNYKIEKDLLKETFSSNYQTVNIVLAIVLGVFSVIGFLGIRDIGSLRKEFISELERLNGLSREFEKNVVKIDEEQRKVKEEYVEMLKANEEQNKRIKILELQEKITALINGNNPQRALEYAAIALDLSPDNLVLLEQKAISQWHANDLAGAATTFMKMFNIDSNEIGALINALEVYLISNRIVEYETLLKKHSQQIESRENSVELLNYFEILKHYQTDDFKELKVAMLTNLDKFKPGKAKRFNWNFKDVNRFLATKPTDKKKEIITLFISMLKGDLDRDEVIKQVAAVN